MTAPEVLALALFADLTTLPWDQAPEGLRRGSLTVAHAIAAQYARLARQEDADAK